MIDILVNEQTHDLEFSNFDLQLNEGIGSIVQSLKIRLLFFKGEWFLDTTTGLPFYELLLIKNPYIPAVDAIIKAFILATPDVTELLKYESSYNARTRKHSISFLVNTIYGQTTFSEEIP
jgi:hypothetical protein